jgi:hypothetical protein
MRPCRDHAQSGCRRSICKAAARVAYRRFDNGIRAAHFKYSMGATISAPWATSMPVIHLIIVIAWPLMASSSACTASLTSDR